MKKIIKLKKGEEKRILSGHLWVFSNEINEVLGNPETGDIVELRTNSGKFIGKGFYNPKSLIIFRLLTYYDEEIDFNFFQNKIQTALKLRIQLFPDSEIFRLVHGESDYLPGLVIDKYKNYFSVQTFSAGMELRLAQIYEVLNSLFNPEGIVRRDESNLRSLEGLGLVKEIIQGNIKPAVVLENDIKFEIDLLEGQKTGLFLDQRENRFSLRRYTKGLKVLDCFCNDGGFALNAAFAGAQTVKGVDISEATISRATNNAKLNLLEDKCSFVKADAFDFLNKSVDSGAEYDMIILDPPSFTKSKKNIHQAKAGYKEINTAAIKLLRHQGILATASCSHHMDATDFLDIIKNCATKAGRSIQLLEWNGASPDHPVLPAMNETGYLKFGIFKIL